MLMLALALVFFLSLLPMAVRLLTSSSSSSGTTPRRLPPGPAGIPVVGGTVGFLLALRANEAERWAARQVGRYGPVSRHFLFGTRTVLLAGPAANKFLFTSESLVPQQVRPLARMIGERNVMQLAGEEHRRVRAAVVRALRLDVLKQYVARVDQEVRRHIDTHWTGRQRVNVLPLAKRFSFDNSCSFLFGIEHGALREELRNEFIDIMDGVWLSALGELFLSMSKSMGASRRARAALTGILRERRSSLEQGQISSNRDFITSLIGVGSNGDEEALADEEIVDNAMLMLIAGYDTSSILITYLVYYLASHPNVLAEVTREQEEIANSKASGEDALTWEDIVKMKYTWRVAMETLRMVPPTFGSLRKVLKDVEYNGYLIPKGWHVLWIANVTQMDANIFHDPENFDPTRFEAPPAPFSFVSFGGGPRVCPGTEFARLQTLVLMHYLVTRFKWKLCDGDDDAQRMSHAPSPSKGLPIQLEPKKKSSDIISYM